jgi:uncharacterized protein (TIGR02271 family)
VTAQATDADADTVEDIMERHSPVDLQHRATMWSDENWTGFDASAAPYTADQIATERQRYYAATTDTRPNEAIDTTARQVEGQQKFERVEEELQVGKRDVERGGVRVRSYVVTTPVEEDITLREEHVTIERHPVNRAATEADFNTFKEGTIELTEHAEEAVVSKRARVIEEIVVGKEATERVEHISDEVRRTEVEIENIGEFATFDTDYRTHYKTTFGNSGYTYEQYTPAYRYGYTLGRDYNYPNWSAAEAAARTRWEQTNQGTWEDFKDAIRYGWERVTGQR